MKGETVDVNGIFREYKGYAFYLSEKNKGGVKMCVNCACLEEEDLVKRRQMSY